VSDTKYGESYTRDGLPDEVFLRVMRRADAEQNRHVNLGRIADALGKEDGLQKSFKKIEQHLGRIADALDRAYPEPDEEDDIPRNDAGMPIPPWTGDDGGVDYDDTTAADWGIKPEKQLLVKPWTSPTRPASSSQTVA
jgi:hypothetical protein